jgi:hypothetical protein
MEQGCNRRPHFFVVVGMGSRDGILGHQFEFCSMLFTVFLQANFQRKPDSSLVLEIHTKNSAKQENLNLFVKAVCRKEK